MDEDNLLPPDEMYENGIIAGEILESADWPTSVTDRIDWEQSVKLTDAERNACVIAAAHFHYANTAHFLVAGKVIHLRDTGPDPLTAKKLAALLTLYKLEDMDVWGRYMSRIDGGHEISSPMQRYYNYLFNEDKVFSILLAMETLAVPVARTLYETLQDSGDALFQQLTTNLIRQKEEEEQLAVRHLGRLVDQLPPEDQQYATAVADRYCRIAIRMLKEHRRELNVFGINPLILYNDVETAINAFYERIRLPA